MITKYPCTLCGKPIESGQRYYEIKTKKKTDTGRSHYIHAECWDELPKRGDREEVVK